MTICLIILTLNLFELIDGRSIDLESHVNPKEVKYFEKKLDSRIGYWSPSTSSIDWCERNYVVTSYIAEFWNCISSFSMCLLGLILFIRGFRNRIEKRFLLSSIGLTIVGLGSAYFHGTLTYFGQMADELPMVYSMIIWWFILFQMNEINRNQSLTYKWILFGLAYALLWTYVHTLKSFVIIFQGHMSLMVLGAIIKFISLYRQSIHCVRQLKYLLIVYISLLAIAFICWIIDQQLCDKFNRLSRINPQLHAWWHVLGAIHCHLGIVISELMRFISIQSQQKTNNFKPNDHVHLLFYFGLPFVNYHHQQQKQQKQK